MQATVDNPIPRRAGRSAVRSRRRHGARAILSGMGCALLAVFDFYSR